MNDDNFSNWTSSDLRFELTLDRTIEGSERKKKIELEIQKRNLQQQGNKSDDRLKNATLLAPLAPVLLMLTFFPFTGSFAWGLIIVFFTVISSYSAVLFFGLPLVYLLRYFRILNLPLLVLLGSILGVVAWYLVLLFLGKLLGSHTNVGLHVLSGAGFGFIVSISFGLIAGIARK